MNIYVHTPGREFLWPYIKKAASAHTLTDNAGEADVAIMVSSTDIYTPGELLLAAESTPTNPDSAWIGHESAFAAGCENCRTVILRCPNVIGTAMTGFPRELAESIFRGTFFHFKGNEARVGAVHAADVAAAIAALAEMPTAEGIYNISDGENPKLHDLAEAIRSMSSVSHMPPSPRKTGSPLSLLMPAPVKKTIFFRFSFSICFSFRDCANLLLLEILCLIL